MKAMASGLERGHVVSCHRHNIAFIIVSCHRHNIALLTYRLVVVIILIINKIILVTRSVRT